MNVEEISTGENGDILLQNRFRRKSQFVPEEVYLIIIIGPSWYKIFVKNGTKVAAR